MCQEKKQEEDSRNIENSMDTLIQRLENYIKKEQRNKH